MSEPIRVLHFADIHVGMENYGRLDPTTGTSTRVRDFLDRMDEVIDYALENDADLAVFAGDAFKNRDPDPTQQREFARRIKRLADVMPTLLVVGNHDMPGMAARASSVDIFQTLAVPSVIVGNKPEGRVIQTKRGPVFLAWMPYPMRNRLLVKEEYQGKTIEELEVALREVVSEIVRDLAGQAVEEDMPRLLAGHFTVEKARFGSERSVMLGKDVAVFSSTLADEAWDYVALGHIHRHQDLSEGEYPPVVYSGSLERIDFGEEAEPKGFCWVELLRGNSRWSFVPVAARPFRTVRIDARGMDDPTAAVLEQIGEISVEEAVIRIQIHLTADQQAEFREREVDKALQDATSVIISREIEDEARTRLGDLSPETLTSIALVERYFQSKALPEERIHTLLEKAEEILRDPN
jgi:exonuclease SbcD